MVFIFVHLGAGNYSLTKIPSSFPVSALCVEYKQLIEKCLTLGNNQFEVMPFFVFQSPAEIKEFGGDRLVDHDPS